MGTAAQTIRLVDQQINPLPTLQHPLDILRHDVAHAVDLLARRGQRIRRRRRVVGLQQRAQLGVERRAAVRRQRREVGRGGWVGGQELALYLQQEGERDAAAELGCGDDQVAERGVRGEFLGLRAIFGRAGRRVGDVVHEEPFVGVRQFLGLAVRDLGQDDGGQ